MPCIVGFGKAPLAIPLVAPNAASVGGAYRRFGSWFPVLLLCSQTGQVAPQNFTHQRLSRTRGIPEPRSPHRHACIMRLLAGLVQTRQGTTL